MSKARNLGRIAQDTSASGTGAIDLPSGTTAERPTGSGGLIRHNSTTGLLEFFDTVANQWTGVGEFTALGGTVTTYSSGGTSYRVHTFTSSGVFQSNARLKSS